MKKLKITKPIKEKCQVCGKTGKRFEIQISMETDQQSIERDPLTGRIFFVTGQIIFCRSCKNKFWKGWEIGINPV